MGVRYGSSFLPFFLADALECTVYFPLGILAAASVACKSTCLMEFTPTHTEQRFHNEHKHNMQSEGGSW